MELLTDFFVALWELTAAMAPYILFGLLFAGILHELIPDDFVQKHLGRDSVASVAKATLFGIPLPVCSCGVIPLAAALKKEGASRGAVLSFLVSTPITGVDAILATLGMFGWLFTLYRVASSVVIAFTAGVLANLFGEREENAPKAPFTVSNLQSPLSNPAPTSCCCQGSCESEAKKHFDLSAALTYGFVTLLGDITRPLFWGLLVGAAITVAIPDHAAEMLAEYRWAGYLLVLAIAVPMYVCATASLPIAASLILAGVTPGAAFVFLTAGPATNTVTIGVVKKMLGRRTLTIYLGSIVAGSFFFGFLLDTLFDTMRIDPAHIVAIDKKSDILSSICAAILWISIIHYEKKSIIGKFFTKDRCHP